MRISLLLLGLALMGCARTPEPPAPSAQVETDTFAGYYTSGFETSEFRPKDKKHERWWLTGSLPCSFLSFNQEGNAPWHRVYVEVQGTLSPAGQYGHMGAYHRELAVSRMVSCRPLREDEKVEP